MIYFSPVSAFGKPEEECAKPGRLVTARGDINPLPLTSSGMGDEFKASCN
jgi:hypothetical protein